MTDAARHDAWISGDNYDRYIGRWSRKIAPVFLEWLDADTDLCWLDVGCGTGALSRAIVELYAPAELTGIEPNESFRQCAEKAVSDAHARFISGDALSLPLPDQTRHITVSGLMLNFVADRSEALAEMKRVTVTGGTVAYYVWDYAGGGLQLLRAFWDAAVELDPAAREFSDGIRFSWCNPEFLSQLAIDAGLKEVQVRTIEVPSIFDGFDDYWDPFTLGTGSAPGYYQTLAESKRHAIRTLLEKTLPQTDDGTIELLARVWAVKGRV